MVSTRVPVGDRNPLVHLAVDELEGDQVGDELRVSFGIEGAEAHDDLVLLGVVGADNDVSLLQINVLVREPRHHYAGTVDDVRCASLFTQGISCRSDIK